MKTDPDVLYVLSEAESVADAAKDTVWLLMEDGALLGAPTDIVNKLDASLESGPVVIDVVGQIPSSMGGWTLWLG